MTLAGSFFEPVTWRDLVAVGVLINDLSPHAIARCAGVSHADATEALTAAVNEGVLSDGVIGPSDAATLVSELSPTVVAEVHSAAARFLMSQGPSRLLETIEHFRSAGTRFPSPELASIADRAGWASLSVGDYSSAREFLEFADEVGALDSSGIRAERLTRLAAALDGLGLTAESRLRLAAAFDIAETDGNADLAIEAAVNYTFPVDWYAGDRRTTALLERAEALATTREHRTKVRAARSMAEIRIPLPSGNDQQVAWVTRPSVAQPLSEVALAESVDTTGWTRLLALVAWRTTHRDPAYLEQRRSVSREAFDLAQHIRHPSRQVDAAVMVAVDALESGDRPGFDQALTVLRWVAEVDKNPRHLWHAYAVAAGAAHLDGDLASAERYRHLAREIGMSVNSPGWLGAELLLLAQELFARQDPVEVAEHLPDESATALLSPIGKLFVSLGHCLLGNTALAEDLLGLAMRQFEPEASWLVCHTRAADVALQLGDDTILEYLWQALLPWRDHVAVDSQAWLCDGPISGWLALIAHRRNDIASARRFLADADRVARQLGDARTLHRLGELRATIGVHSPCAVVRGSGLTTRESVVLQHMIDGLTNPQIADMMSLSPSTIRNELSSIYRKFGVSTRAEAAAVAISMGLAQRGDPTDAPSTLKHNPD